MFKVDLTKILGEWARLEGKLKIIILILVILMVANLFITLGLQNSKTALLKEYKDANGVLPRCNDVMP